MGLVSAYERALWRTGRKLGRTIYAQVSSEPTDNDVFLGLMENEQLATMVVKAHNERLLLT